MELRLPKSQFDALAVEDRATAIAYIRTRQRMQAVDSEENAKEMEKARRKARVKHGA
jgi:hypothetical protein